MLHVFQRLFIFLVFKIPLIIQVASSPGGKQPQAHALAGESGQAANLANLAEGRPGSTAFCIYWGMGSKGAVQRHFVMMPRTGQNMGLP